MNSKSKRLARAIGATVTVARWVIIALLVLLVPATIVGFLSPGAVPMAAVDPGAASGAGASFPAGYFLLYALATLALVLVVVSKLRHIMQTASDDMPFVAANASRLRTIAAAMAGLAILPMLVRPFMSVAARVAANMTQPHFNFGLWLGALVVLVLAEVFREGTRLRADADMTV